MNKAPQHLSPESEEFYSHVAGNYELDSHHLKLLEASCDAWDRMIAARQIIDDAGSVVFVDRFEQPRQHPAVRIEQESRSQFMRLIRELDLDEGESWPAKRRNG